MFGTYGILNSEPNSPESARPLDSSFDQLPSPKSAKKSALSTRNHYKPLNERDSQPNSPRSPLNSPPATAQKTTDATTPFFQRKRPTPLHTPHQKKKTGSSSAPVSPQANAPTPNSPLSADDTQPTPALMIAAQRVKQIQQAVISFNGRRYRVSYDSNQQLSPDAFKEFCLSHLEAALNLANTDEQKAIFTKPFTLSNTATGILVCPKEEANAPAPAQGSAKVEIVIPDDRRPENYKDQKADIWQLFTPVDEQELGAFNTQRIKEAEAATQATAPSNTTNQPEANSNKQARVVFRRVNKQAQANNQTKSSTATNSAKKSASAAQAAGFLTLHNKANSCYLAAFLQTFMLQDGQLEAMEKAIEARPTVLQTLIDEMHSSNNVLEANKLKGYIESHAEIDKKLLGFIDHCRQQKASGQNINFDQLYEILEAIDPVAFEPEARPHQKDSFEVLTTLNDYLFPHSKYSNRAASEISPYHVRIKGTKTPDSDYRGVVDENGLLPVDEILPFLSMNLTPEQAKQKTVAFADLENGIFNSVSEDNKKKELIEKSAPLTNPDKLIYQFKRKWHDGTNAQVFTGQITDIPTKHTFNNIEYTLSSVICHQGGSDAGHYNTIIFKNGVPYLLDDVYGNRELSIKESQQIASKKAVGFVYEKTNRKDLSFIDPFTGQPTEEADAAPRPKPAAKPKPTLSQATKTTSTSQAAAKTTTTRTIQPPNLLFQIDSLDNLKVYWKIQHPNKEALEKIAQELRKPYHLKDSSLTPKDGLEVLNIEYDLSSKLYECKIFIQQHADDDADHTANINGKKTDAGSNIQQAFERVLEVCPNISLNLNHSKPSMDLIEKQTKEKTGAKKVGDIANHLTGFEEMRQAFEQRVLAQNKV